MQVGDMIRLRGEAGRTGVLVSYGNFSVDWWEILDSEGRLVVWPESQIEVINASR
jgi:hypothetical protein